MTNFLTYMPGAHSPHTSPFHPAAVSHLVEWRGCFVRGEVVLKRVCDDIDHVHLCVAGEHVEAAHDEAGNVALDQAH